MYYNMFFVAKLGRQMSCHATTSYYQSLSLHLIYIALLQFSCAVPVTGGVGKSLQLCFNLHCLKHRRRPMSPGPCDSLSLHLFAILTHLRHLLRIDWALLPSSGRLLRCVTLSPDWRRTGADAANESLGRFIDDILTWLTRNLWKNI